MCCCLVYLLVTTYNALIFIKIIKTRVQMITGGGGGLPLINCNQPGLSDKFEVYQTIGILRGFDPLL